MLRPILMNFSLICDIRTAVIKYLISKYIGTGARYFDMDTITCTDNTLYNMIVSSPSINPVSLLLKERFKKSADNIYNETIEKNYEDILNIAKPTQILKLESISHQALDGTVIDIHVNCKNDLEKEYIKNLDPKVKIEDNITDLGDTYGSMFIYDINELDLIKGLPGKYIYFANIRANYSNDDLEPLPVVKFLSKHCFMQTVDIYSGITLYTPHKEDILK